MEQDGRLWGLERRDGNLLWAGCSLTDLARDHGTPLYVVNASLLKDAHDAIRRPFDAEGLETRLFFSYKTNPVPAVLRCLTRLGCGAEVISTFELWLAARLGVAGRDMIINGTWKSPELLQQAVQRDVGLINLEGLDELRRLQTIVPESGRCVRIGLRINPCLSTSPFDFTLASGARSSHAGFRRESRAWADALRLVRGEPRFELTGLQFHIGSGVRSSRPYAAALRVALEMWTDLLEMGFHPTVLDLGGGFAARTLKEFSLAEAIRFFAWKRSPGIPRGAEGLDLPADVARACSRLLRRYACARGVPVPTIFLEPGRALVATSQLLLLRVVDLRTRPRGRPVAVCDAGALSLSPLLFSEGHAVLHAGGPRPGPPVHYDILGNLPAPLDLVALGQKLPRIETGDILAVMDAGAYFTSLGNNFAGPRPPIVLIENGHPVLVRERETFGEMVGRDTDLRDGRWNGLEP